MPPGPCLLAKQLRYIEAMKILLTDEPFDAQGEVLTTGPYARPDILADQR